MSAQQSKQFTLGEQPEWAGREPNTKLPTSFIQTLLKEDNTDSLINRGYCIVELDAQTTSYYSKFHTLIEQFFSLKNTAKEKYALLQFDAMNNSPNQCHGYSQVSNLKEQFMMRCIGNITEKHKNAYIFPDCGDGNFGKYGMQIYQVLDLKSRQLAKNTMIKLGKLGKYVDDLLDPINKINNDIDKNILQNDKHTFSTFMPNEYISSSIMDNFHYYAPSHDKHKKFYNNHACHTDSGLMTAVIITDEPGLELFDQKIQKWIQIEELMQTYLKENGLYKENELCHRKYATFFWSDSVEYLNNAPFVNGGIIKKKIKPLFHRVADCKNERYSVVFKQRTAPLRTHCRYQEDYILASIQQKVDTESKNAYTLWNDKKQNVNKTNDGNDLWLYGTVAFLAVFGVCLYAYKK
eukprot:329568_1